MNWTWIIEFLGISGIITTGVVWLIKTLGKHSLNLNLKRYESELKNKAQVYKLELDKNLETHKAELSIAHTKVSKLHETRMAVLAKLYKRIFRMDTKMREMIAMLKRVLEDADKEEQERIRAAGTAYNEFMEYYGEHKIFFSKKLCGSIDNLRSVYLHSYMDYIFPISFNVKDSKQSYESAKKAAEAVQEKIPPILEGIEDEFRKLLNVEE